MKKYFVLAALIAAAQIASGQTVSVGALGGVPVTDTTGYSDQSRPYIVGGSVEVQLPAGFALEANALYRRVGNTTYSGIASGTGSGLFIIRERGNSWEFPLLGKYYFRRTSGWQPFLGTGFAFRTVEVKDSGNLVTTNASGSPQTVLVEGTFREPLEVGATVAGGVRFHYRRLAVLPQVRYTRWGGTSAVVRSNETSFLLGLMF
jgi:opacity protein-like surface antigen